MKINSYSPSQSYSNKPNFKANPATIAQKRAAVKAQNAFKWIGDQCKIEDGSLTRNMFLAVSFLFLVGARFLGARDNDERREVLTRDIPAVVVSGIGANLLYNPISKLVTKKTGIPIAAANKDGILNFVSQKQVKDWYSELGKNPDALENFVETVDKNGGSIKKIMAKFGFKDKLEAISNLADNTGIIGEIKKAKTGNKEAFDALENALKNVENKNKVLKFAKNTQAAVKLGSITLTAAFLGYLLPALNIMITKNKYKGKVDEAEMKKKIQRTNTNTFRLPSSVISFHHKSARKTFQSLLSMAEPAINSEK